MSLERNSWIPFTRVIWNRRKREIRDDIIETKGSTSGEIERIRE